MLSFGRLLAFQYTVSIIKAIPDFGQRRGLFLLAHFTTWNRQSAVIVKADIAGLSNGGSEG